MITPSELNYYYKVLDLKPGASLELVDQAYKDLAFIWHPDRIPEENQRLKKSLRKNSRKSIKLGKNCVLYCVDQVQIQLNIPQLFPVQNPIPEPPQIVQEIPIPIKNPIPIINPLPIKAK
jgi:hypothetical protein